MAKISACIVFCMAATLFAAEPQEELHPLPAPLTQREILKQACRVIAPGVEHRALYFKNPFGDGPVNVNMLVVYWKEVPKEFSLGIATCGGICPGLNNVIRAVVRCFWYRYGVRRISGIRFGYRGLLENSPYPLLTLDPDVVDEIQEKGGTILGSSRGGGDKVEEIVDSLERLNINILITIGGDGTLRGAYEIGEEIKKRGLKISVIGVPKTIDNDLSFIQN